MVDNNKNGAGFPAPFRLNVLTFDKWSRVFGSSQA
jgi:hypothetical protein